MRTRKQLTPHWDDILLLPGQLAHPPRLQSEPLSLRTVIGRRAERPLVLDVPFFVSHMSFGALSVSAKTALARVSAELGTAIGSGEGGMLDEEREHASKEIFEMASGYFGWAPEQVERADAVEIKIGQSAKAGSGHSCWPAGRQWNSKTWRCGSGSTSRSTTAPAPRSW